MRQPIRTISSGNAKRGAILLYVVFACSVIMSFFFSYRAGMSDASDMPSAMSAMSVDDSARGHVGPFGTKCSLPPTDYAYCLNDPQGIGVHDFFLGYMETREFRLSNPSGTGTIRVTVNSGGPVRTILVWNAPLPPAKLFDTVITNAQTIEIPSNFTGAVLYFELLGGTTFATVTSLSSTVVSPSVAQIVLTEPVWSATRTLGTVRVDYFLPKTSLSLDEYHSFDMYIH